MCVCDKEPLDMHHVCLCVSGSLGVHYREPLKTCREPLGMRVCVGMGFGDCRCGCVMKR